MEIKGRLNMQFPNKHIERHTGPTIMTTFSIKTPGRPFYNSFGAHKGRDSWAEIESIAGHLDESATLSSDLLESSTQSLKFK